jgi:flagellar basal body-associated protein FliL
MVIPSTIKVIYSSQNGQMRVQSMNQRNIILLIAIVALSAVAIGFFTMPSQKPQATEPNVTPTPSPSRPLNQSQSQRTHYTPPCG